MGRYLVSVISITIVIIQQTRCQAREYSVAYLSLVHVACASVISSNGNMDSGEHRDHEFADVALEKVLEARRWPWAKLPEKLGEALRAELPKSTGIGVPEAVRQGGPLGYVALYQRIR